MAKHTCENFPWDSYDSIQDPIYHSYISVDVFFNSYQDLLESLNGEDCDSYIESFFTPSVINSRMLVFIDEDARMDFEDLAVEMKLIPSLKEICEGEDRIDKEARKKREEDNKRSQQIQKTKNPKKLNSIERSQLRQEQMMKSMNKLRSRMNNESDPAVLKSIQEKMKRINDQLDIPVTI